MSIDNNAWEPKIIVFACNWCTDAAADLAGLNHLEYPVDVRMENVKCSGKIDPLQLLQSYQNGADGIMIAGCTSKDCLYGSEFEYDQKKHRALNGYLQSMGIDKGRFQAFWPLDMEGPDFKEAFTLLNQEIKRLGPIKQP